MQTANYRLRNAAILGAFVLIGGAWRQHSLADQQPAEVKTVPLVQVDPLEMLNAALTEQSDLLNGRMDAIQGEIEQLRAEFAEFRSTPVPEPPTVAVAIPDLQEPIEELPAIPIAETLATYDSDGYLTNAAVKSWLEQSGHRDHWSYPSGNDTVSEHVSHLVSGNHGWRREQLDGLTYRELEQLHSADHDGLIGPRSEVQVALALADSPAEGIPVRFQESDGYWHWTHNGRDYRWHTLEEGRTYGGRFLFQDGVMCPTGAVESSPTVRVSSGTSNCPNGRCGLPVRSGRGWRIRGW